MTTPTLEGLIAWHEQQYRSNAESAISATIKVNLEKRAEFHRRSAELLRQLSAPKEGLCADFNKRANYLDEITFTTTLDPIVGQAMSGAATALRYASAALSTKTEDEEVGAFVRSMTPNSGRSIHISKGDRNWWIQARTETRDGYTPSDWYGDDLVSTVRAAKGTT